MLCAAFGVADEMCYTGGSDGKVYHWNKTTLVKVVEFHRGPVFAIQPVEKVITLVHTVQNKSLKQF